MSVLSNSHNRSIRKRSLIQKLQEIHRSQERGDREVNLANQFLQLYRVIQNRVSFDCNIHCSRMVRQKCQSFIGVYEIINGDCHILGGGRGSSTIQTRERFFGINCDGHLVKILCS